MFAIYALKDATGRVVYVGKTVQPLSRRLACHLYKARSGRGNGTCSQWLAALQRSGGPPPTIELLERCQSGQWQERERWWIKALGPGLLNDTDGGNGAHKRTQFPAEHRHLLGQISDCRLAEQIGMSREMVAYHRRKEGLPPSWDVTLTRVRHPCRGRPAHNRHQLDETLLGVVSDYRLAKVFGCSKTAVANRRKKLGIPAKER